MKIPLIDLEEFKKQYSNIDKEFLEKEDIEVNYQPFNIENLQTYNPIYAEFFEMNENNYSKISMNHKHAIVNLNTIRNVSTNETINKDIFIKFSPLLDPLRYMIGKYEIENSKTRALNKKLEKHCAATTPSDPAVWAWFQASCQ